MILLNLLLQVNPKLNKEGKKVLTIASKGTPPFELFLSKEVPGSKNLKKVPARPQVGEKFFHPLSFKTRGLPLISPKVAGEPEKKAVGRAVEKGKAEFKRERELKVPENLKVLKKVPDMVSPSLLKERPASVVVKPEKDEFTDKEAGSKEVKAHLSTPVPLSHPSLTPKSSERTFEKVKEAGSTENLTGKEGKEIKFHYSEKVIKLNVSKGTSFSPGKAFKPLKGAPYYSNHLYQSLPGGTSEPLKKANKTLPFLEKNEGRKPLSFTPLAKSEEMRKDSTEKLFSLLREREKTPITVESKPKAPLKGSESEFFGREFAAVKERAPLLKEEAKQKVSPEKLPVENFTDSRARPQVFVEVPEKTNEVKVPTVKPKKRKGKLLNFEVKEPSLKFRSSDFEEVEVKPPLEGDSRSSSAPFDFTKGKASLHHAERPAGLNHPPPPSQGQGEPGSRPSGGGESGGREAGAPRHSAATNSNFHSFVVRSGEVLMRLSFNRAGFLNLTLHLPETFSAEPFLAQEIRSIIRSSGFTPGKVYLKVKGRGEVRERLTELRV